VANYSLVETVENHEKS